MSIRSTMGAFGSASSCAATGAGAHSQATASTAPIRIRFGVITVFPSPL